MTTFGSCCCSDSQQTRPTLRVGGEHAHLRIETATQEFWTQSMYYLELHFCFHKGCLKAKAATRVWLWPPTNYQTNATVTSTKSLSSTVTCRIVHHGIYQSRRRTRRWNGRPPREGTQSRSEEDSRIGGKTGAPYDLIYECVLSQTLHIGRCNWTYQASRRGRGRDENFEEVCWGREWRRSGIVS